MQVTVLPPGSYSAPQTADLGLAVDFFPLPIEHDQDALEKDVSVYVKMEDDLTLLASTYAVANPAEVRRFLRAHMEVVEALLEAHEHIQKVFGETRAVDLEVHLDPEEDFEAIFAVVRTHLPPHEALDLLDQFDDHWFLDNVAEETAAIFSVTVRPE